MAEQDTDAAIEEQIRYYRSRAPEYDEWFQRQGRYDRGPEQQRLWLEEVEALRQALAGAGLRGHLLELACGTGWWTEVLLEHASRITALDASPEVIALNRARLASHARTLPPVGYVRANVFDWHPPQRYDGVFFGFWLSHVPPVLFERFWHIVEACLAPGGRVFFVDSLEHPEHAARDNPLERAAEARVRRVLNDGREFEIIKVFHDPQELARRLAGLGWSFEIGATPRYFIHGAGSRSADTDS